MNLVFDQSFDKKVDKLKNKAVAQKILKIIDICENVFSINDIPNIKKMKGYKSFYRIKV
jgi:mRNA interferase RelE/StbE